MKKLLLASLAALTLTACVQEASRTLPIQKVESAARPHMGVRVPVSVGNFDNRSSFMRGVFSNNEDRMGIRDAVNTLVSGIENGAWRPAL